MRTQIVFAVATLGLLGVACSAVGRAMPSLERGKVVYDHWCAACHDAGSGHPGTTALQAKYKGSIPAELERRTDLTPDTVHYFIRNGVSIMPFFRKTEISPGDEADLSAYLARRKR